MKCKATTTRLNAKGVPLWYNVKKDGQLIGSHCVKCYDKIRRLPLFQNFKEKLKQRTCSNCGGKTTTEKSKGYSHERWYKDGKGGFWCLACRFKLIDYPKRSDYFKNIANPKTHAKWSPKRYQYKNKVMYANDNPRIGICSNCGRSIEAGDIKRTNLHHKKYEDKKPLSHTIELCVPCHMLKHKRGPI